MLHRFLFTLLALASLGGCNVIPVEEPVDQVNNLSLDVGYVAGFFNNLDAGSSYGYVLVLKNVDTGQEINMPIGGGDRANKNTVGMISIPPGAYVINDWMTYLAGTRVFQARASLRIPALREPFLVERGKVVFLGRFEMQSTEFSTDTHKNRHWRLRTQDFSEQQAAQELRRKFPSLSNSKVTCLLCVGWGFY